MKTPFAEHSNFYLMFEQKPEQAVNISEWSIGGDFNPYEQGTRAKFEVYCPKNSTHPFLIPSHRYLYKKSFEYSGGTMLHHQFWVEIAAYNLGRAIGIEVPPAFVAYRELPDSQELEYACLIEWFYGYPLSRHYGVDRGGDYMSLYIPGYDREKGREHNFETIKEVFTNLEVVGWRQDWAKILLFDTLIGNTDRHQENWEIISHFEGSFMRYLSPAFDNGTALGFQILENKIAGKMNGLDGFIAKGTHHMKWRRQDKAHAGHFDLLAKLVDAMPETKEVIAEALCADFQPAYDAIRQFTVFEIYNPLYRLS